MIAFILLCGLTQADFQTCKLSKSDFVQVQLYDRNMYNMSLAHNKNIVVGPIEKLEEIKQRAGKNKLWAIWGATVEEYYPKEGKLWRVKIRPEFLVPRYLECPSCVRGF